MARSNEVQYVRYYTSGSAAQKVELPQKVKKQPKPRAQKVQIPLTKLDGLAAVGIVVAAVMLVCMLMGFAQVCAINRQIQDMEVYVSKLEAQQDDLQAQYDHGYNLEEIRLAAESMGLVSVDQVQHITVSVPLEEPVQELTWWETLLENIRYFFA